MARKCLVQTCCARFSSGDVKSSTVMALRSYDWQRHGKARLGAAMPRRSDHMQRKARAWTSIEPPRYCISTNRLGSAYPGEALAWCVKAR